MRKLPTFDELPLRIPLRGGTRFCGPPMRPKDSSLKGWDGGSDGKMTGEHASPDGVCGLCGGKLRPGEATIPFVRGERIFTIRQVPALICSECSEAYMTGPVVDE